MSVKLKVNTVLDFGIEPLPKLTTNVPQGTQMHYTTYIANEAY